MLLVPRQLDVLQFAERALQMLLLLKSNRILCVLVNRGDGRVQHTFAILPRCVPRQAEERREDNNRSGHSSISEPHLISAMPPLG